MMTERVRDIPADSEDLPTLEYGAPEETDRQKQTDRQREREREREICVCMCACIDG